MPYIKAEDRPIFEADLERLAATIDVAAINGGNIDHGKLNYVLSSLIDRLHYKASYENLSKVKAALNDAAAEFQRRRIDPYEDGKIRANGDVYRPLQ